MAGKKKKFKNIKLEQTELTPTSIGIFENRRKSSVGTVLILGVFIVAVVFLPQISELIENYKSSKQPTTVIKPKPVKPVVPVEPEEEENFYAFGDNLVVTNNDISVSNFVIDEKELTISYDITNNLNQSQNIEELNYYLEIFNKEQTLVERVKLASEYTLASDAFQSFKRNISLESATTIGYISILKKVTSDYPDVSLHDTNVIVCLRDHEKVTYKFNENKLKEVTSEISYVTTDTDYEKYREENIKKSNSYNNQMGISSTNFQYTGGYNITTNCNLSEMARTYIFHADTFTLDTEPKVVKFEMEAQNFKCE